VEASATAEIAYFKNAKGTITLRASRKENKAPFVQIAYEQNLANWTDPSGLLKVEDPAATVKIAWQDDSWKVDGNLRGTLLLDTDRIEAGAKEWLKDLFSGVRLGFELPNINNLGDLKGDGKASISLKVATGRLNVKLWDIFELDLEGLRLGRDILDLTALCRFTLPGGGLFEGRIPSLKIGLGPKVSLGVGGDGLNLAGKLRLPQGVKASLELARKNTRGIQVLEGKGSLVIPGVPEMALLTRIGRLEREGKLEPLLRIRFLAGGKSISGRHWPANGGEESAQSAIRAKRLIDREERNIMPDPKIYLRKLRNGAQPGLTRVRALLLRNRNNEAGEAVVWWPDFEKELKLAFSLDHAPLYSSRW
jgi:hypothetical protein